jgi:hypothetical protein
MSEKQRMQNKERNRCLAIGLVVGMPICGLIGMTLGIAIGEGLYQRRRERDEKAP